MALATPALAAPIFEEDFSTQSKSPSPWTIVNKSTPVGETTWQTGPIYTALESRQGDYNFMAVNHASAGNGTDAIASNWLLLPALPLTNGQRLTFDTIGMDGEGYPDRLQVRLNPANNGANVGETALSVGDFSVLLLDINPGYANFPQAGAYPTQWTTYSIDLQGIQTPGAARLAFRYFVENSGPEGSQGNEIAIDNVRVAAVPEPATLLPLIGAGLLIRQREKRRRP